MSRGTVAGLLLDLDGTLVDSEPIHRATYRSFFADRGWAVEDLSVFIGRRAKDVFATTPGPWAGADPDELADAVRSFVPVGAVPEPVVGARALFEAAARARVPVAIVTSADPDWVEVALTVLGVAAHVRVVVTSHDVVDGKPDPAGFALASARLAVRPADCVAVEDSPAGVQAAVAAGVGQVYGVSTTHVGALLAEAGALAVDTDLRALPGRLGWDGPAVAGGLGPR